MEDNEQSSWIDPDGVVYPLRGKGHSEFAYEILLNKGLGEHMGKKVQMDGTTEEKGKSGEVAKFDAQKDLGTDPSNPKHSATLCGLGWIQASCSRDAVIIRSKSISALSRVWCPVASLAASFPSVVFAIGRHGSGVSVGLYGKDMSIPADKIIGRISEVVSGRAVKSSGSRWSVEHSSIRYFE